MEGTWRVGPLDIGRGRRRLATLISITMLVMALLSSSATWAAAEPPPTGPPTASDGSGEAGAGAARSTAQGAEPRRGTGLLGRFGGFADVGDLHPFAAEIGWLVDGGVAEGYADGTFQPAAPVSRQAAAAFFARYDGADLQGTCEGGAFPDVTSDHAFCREIAWMVDHGLAVGYGDGTFGPTAAVSRQAFAAFLARYGEPDGVEVCSSAVFSDVLADHEFCAQISWMVQNGLADGYGDGTFRPTEPVSRQAAAAFLARFDGLDEPTGPTPQAGWYFQPETILLAPGESSTVRLVHHGEDGTPSGATPPAVLDVLTSHPDIASVEDLGGGEARITAGATVGATMMGAAVGDSEVRVPLAVTVARVKSTVTTIEDSSVAFPVPGDRSAGDADTTELPWHSPSGVGPFTWAELEARLDAPEAGEMGGDLRPGEDESTLGPIGVRYPVVLVGTSVADGDQLLGVAGSGVLGRAHDPSTRDHEGRGFQLVTVEVIDPFAFFDEVKVDIETEDLDRVGVLPFQEHEGDDAVLVDEAGSEPDGSMGRSVRASADDAGNCKATGGIQFGELKAPVKVGVKPHWVSKVDSDFPVIHMEAGVTGMARGGLEFTAQLGAFGGVECEIWKGGILSLPSPLPVGSFIMTKVEQAFTAVLETKATGGPKVEVKAVCEGTITLKAGFRYNGNTNVYEDRNGFDRTFDCEREWKEVDDAPGDWQPIAAEAAVGLDISSPASIQVGGFVVDRIGKWFGKEGLGSAELLEAKFGPKLKLAWENAANVLVNEKAEATAHLEFGGSVALKSKPIVWLLSKVQGGTKTGDLSLTILEGEPLVLATFFRNLNKDGVKLEVEGLEQSGPRAALATDDAVTVTATTRASSGLISNAPLPQVEDLGAWVKWSSGWEELPGFTFVDSSSTGEGVEVVGSFQATPTLCERIGPDDPVTVHLVPETDFLGPIPAFGHAGSFQLTCADPELDGVPGTLEFTVIDLLQASTSTDSVRLELDHWQHTSGATGNWTWEVTSDLPEWLTTTPVSGDDIMRPDALGDLATAEVEIRIDCGELDHEVTHLLEVEAYHDGRTDPLPASVTVTADCGDEYLGFDDGTGQPFGPTPGPFQAPTSFTLDLVSYGTEASTWSAPGGTPSSGTLPASETEAFSVSFDVPDERTARCERQPAFSRQYTVTTPDRGAVSVTVEFRAIPAKPPKDCKPPEKCTKCGGEGGMKRDPHLRTMDGVNFSAQVLGEYTYLAADPLHPDHDPGVELPRVDARHEVTNLVNTGPVQATSITGIAVEVSGHRIEHYERPERMVVIDGVVQLLDEPFAVELEGGVDVSGRGASGARGEYWLEIESEQIEVRSQGTHHPTGSFINAYVQVDPDLPMRGLLGNYDGDRGNDLMTRTGEVVPTSLVHEHSFDLYRLTDSWRLGDESDSLFRFGYEGFHDPNHEVDLEAIAPFREEAATLLASGASLCTGTDLEVLTDSLAWELAIGTDPAELGDLLCDYVVNGQVTVERDGVEYALSNTEVLVSGQGLEDCRTTTNLAGAYTCVLFPGLDGSQPLLDPGPTVTASVAWPGDPDTAIASAATSFPDLAAFGGSQRTTIDIVAPEGAALFVDLSGSATVGGVVPPGSVVEVTFTPQKADGAPLSANARTVRVPVDASGTYEAVFVAPPEAARGHVRVQWADQTSTRTYELTGTSPHVLTLDLDVDVVELSGTYTVNGSPAQAGALSATAYPLDMAGERMSGFSWNPSATVGADGRYQLRTNLPEHAHGMEIEIWTEGGVRTWRLEAIEDPLTVATFDLVAESRTLRLTGTYTRDGSPVGPASLPVVLRQLDAVGAPVPGSEVATAVAVDSDGNYTFERTVPALGTGVEVEFAVLGGVERWTGNPLPLGLTQANLDLEISGIAVVLTAPTALAPDEIRVVPHLWEGSLYEWTDLPAAVVDGVVDGATTRFTAVLPAEAATISVIQVHGGIDGAVTHHRIDPVDGVADLGQLLTHDVGSTRISLSGTASCASCWFLNQFNTDLTVWAYDPVTGIEFELLVDSALVMSDFETGEFAVDVIVPAGVGDVKLTFNAAAEHGGCFTIGANTEMLVGDLDGGHRIVTDIAVAGYQCI